MLARAYEGHFENGNFYANGQIVRLPERKKFLIKMIDEPISDDLDYEDDDDYDYSLYFTDEELQELKDEAAQKGEVLFFGKVN